MRERDEGWVTPPELPITSPDDTPRSRRFRPRKIGSWKVVSGVLVVTTVAAIAWGVTQTNNLQGDINTLQRAALRQDLAANGTVKVTRAKMNILEDHLAVLTGALKGLKKQAGDGLDLVAKEHEKLKKQLAKTKSAVTALKKELKSSKSDGAAIAAAFEEVQSELIASQEAMASLLAAVAEESQVAPSAEIVFSPTVSS